jgi:hypothetical protein
MKKHRSSQNAPGGKTKRRTAPGGAAKRTVRGEAAAQSSGASTKLVGASGAGPGPNAVQPYVSTQQPAQGSAGSQHTVKGAGRTFKNDVGHLDPDRQNLISRMLIEGSTFEDVVEAVNERGGDGITLSAVQNYFQGNLEIQAKRVRRLIESGEALLATVGKDPKSAEARLARATFLTGYLRVRRDASQISPKDAERVRVERENLSLKRRILVMQKEKAEQELKYSNARTRMILLTQEKLKEEILKLQQEAKGHRAGEPMGPEMLQKIQQLYGLACQPLLGEEGSNGSAKA